MLFKSYILVQPPGVRAVQHTPENTIDILKMLCSCNFTATIFDNSIDIQWMGCLEIGDYLMYDMEGYHIVPKEVFESNYKLEIGGTVK